jgi:hypothetical protein
MSKIQLESLECLPVLLSQEALQCVSYEVSCSRSIESKGNFTHDKATRHSFY